jgi:predicted PurR-regulated permease PerM
MAQARPTPTLGDRIRWLGWLSWMMIGILSLASTVLVLVYVVLFRSPVSVLVAPLAIAFVVVYLLNPIVSLLERRGLRRGFGVAGVYVLFLAVVSTILRFAVPAIGEQLTGFIDELPGYANTVIERFNTFAADRGFDVRIDLSSDQISRSIQDNRETIISLIGGVRSVAGQIIHMLVVIVIGIILSVYVLLDLPKIQRGFTNVLPASMREEVLAVLDKVGQSLGGFFRGQLLVATFVGVATAIGLSIIGLDFAILIGLIAGIFNLVPLIGPFLAAIPAVLIGLLSGDPSQALWAAIVLLIVQQIDNHVVSPNVMGRTVKLHPITVMLALLAGATLAGILGMLVVIPAVAATKIVAAHLWTKRGALGVAVDDAPAPGAGGA